MRSNRSLRVEELLVQEISDIVRREMKDPRLGFVTITGAQVSADLRHARVYVSVLGSEEDKAATMAALTGAAGFIRGAFAHRAEMRFVPELRFELDSSAERSARISSLLEQVRRDEQARTGEGGGEGDPKG